MAKISFTVESDAEALKLKQALASGVDYVFTVTQTKPEVTKAVNFLLSALAKNLSDEEWIAAVRHDEKPEVLPIAPRQLEALRGGMIQPLPGDTNYEGYVSLPPWLRNVVR